MDILWKTFNDFEIAQASFRGKWLCDFMKSHAEIPVFAVTLYLTLVFYVPSWMANKQPLKLQWFFAIWNFLLTIFSIYGAARTVPSLIGFLHHNGFRFTVCQNPEVDFYFDGAVGCWTGLFILSKIPELLDTVFLVLQKKDVIFLHWFHHCTVMLYCWHSYISVISTGLWFAGMNFAVHSIMYLYYFLMAIGAKNIVKPFAPIVTTLQLLQMIVGMTVTVFSLVWSDFAADKKLCFVDAANGRMGLCMYTAYFVLFAVLFKKLYLTKGGRKSLVGGRAAGEDNRSGTNRKKGVFSSDDGAGLFLEVDEQPSPKTQSPTGHEKKFR